MRQRDLTDISRTNNPPTRFIPITGIDALPFRLARKVEQADSGCWLWRASKDPCGYGQVWWETRPHKAHRVVYTLAFGPIPDGMELDHLCKVRHCVNPAHLEPVTHQENLLRGDTFQAGNAAKTHCKRGHEFTAENIYLLRDGGRRCRACRASAHLRRRAVA